MLQNVIVKAKRRGKRGLDMNKPAMVYDAYDLYNDATDYGLLWGTADFRRMPMAFATALFGNMGRSYDINVRALVNGTSFYRNYTPMASEYDKPAAPTNIFNQLRLSNIKNVRVFSDYELRTDSGYVADRYNADVTLDFQDYARWFKTAYLPRQTLRDRRPGIRRRILFPGLLSCQTDRANRLQTNAILESRRATRPTGFSKQRSTIIAEKRALL